MLEAKLISLLLLENYKTNIISVFKECAAKSIGKVYFDSMSGS